MPTIEQFVNKFAPLTKEAGEELFIGLKKKSVSKGDYLLREGESCEYLYFVNDGLLKLFSLNSEKEVILRFFPENTLFTVFDGYALQSASRFSIIALESTTVTMIRHEKMEALCRAHYCVEALFRKLAVLAAAKMTRRIAEMLENDATLRYRHFSSENPELVQRISLGDLAKYLGITQQSLSRIRAQH